MIKIDIESVITRLKNNNQKLFDKYKKFCTHGLCYSDSGEVFYESMITSVMPLALSVKQISKIQNKYHSQCDTWKDIKIAFLNEILKEIAFCPYCGKVPLISFEKNNKKLRTFDLDHFFPKSESKYSHLSVNFYNLIPACKGCNQIKSSHFPTSGLIFHPYFGWIDISSFSISSLYNDFNSEYSFLDIQSTLMPHVKDHIDFFNLNEIYRNSRCTITDFRHLLNINNRARDYSLKMKTIHKNDLFVELSREFVPQDHKDILKFSNGKFRKDILEGILRIIK